MRIRKKYRTEGPAHIVRNCSTDRCSKSIHGHTYHWELVLRGDKLDDGGMLMDFGLLGGEIKQFFDAFDHSHMMWNREPEHEFFLDFSDRFVSVPFSPSAENMALLALRVCFVLLARTTLNNGEGNIEVEAVRVHETETGWAEATVEDFGMINYRLDDVKFKHFDLLGLLEGSHVKDKPHHHIDVSKGLLCGE